MVSNPATVLETAMARRNHRTIIDAAILALFAAASLAFLYGMMWLIAGHGTP
jgi:hypothetical protein